MKPKHQVDEIPTGKWSRAKASGRIALRLGWTGAGRLLGRRAQADEALAQTLLRELDGMKGMAMKVGQILSYMDAGFPPAVTAQLAKLQVGVSPMPWPVIKDEIETHLGRSIEALFTRIDPQPIAAASIGQVHVAVTADGRRVAVKVRYPGVEDTMGADFRTLHKLASLAGLFTAVDGQALVEELRARVIEECDYIQEARSQQRFGAILVDDRLIEVPRVVPSHSCDAVLTTQFMEGSRFADFVAEANANTRARAALALFRLNFLPLIQHHVLHADPHPGNQLYLADGRIVALDFGCVRHFDEDFVTQFTRLVDAVAAGDRSEFRQVAIALGLAPRPERIDFDGMWAQYRWMFEPLWRDGFVFTRAWWRIGLRFTKPTAPNARTQGIPPEWIWIQRVVWGLWAVLLELGGEPDFEAAWNQIRQGGAAHAESVHGR